MSKLEEQLRRVDQNASAEHATKQREKSRHGGPVAGEPDDRWIAYHSTLHTRSMLTLVFALSVGGFGGTAAMFGMIGNWLVVAILAACCAASILIAFVIHSLRRGRAAGEQRAYVAGLPFELGGYIETMRQPRWWSGWSYVVVYRPTVHITWATPADPQVVEQLCTLAAAKFRPAPNNGGTFEAQDTVSDPWQWTRGLVSEVVIPLGETTKVTRAELKVARELEYKASAD